jgi:hypothetical protein
MAAWGLAAAMLINAVSFFVYAILVSGLRNKALRRSPTVPAENGIQGAARQALGYRGFFSSPVGLPALTLLFGIFFTVIVDAALVLFALYQLRVSEFGFATLMICWSVGIIISSRLRLEDALPRLRRSLMIATGALGSALTVDAIIAWFPVSVAAALVAGVAHGMQNRILSTMIAVGIDEKERGIAFTLFGALANGAATAGFIAATALVPLTGSRVSLLTAGLGTVASIGGPILVKQWQEKKRALVASRRHRPLT